MPSSVMLLATLMTMAAILPATLTRRHNHSGIVAFCSIGVSGFRRQQLRQRPPGYVFPRPSSSLRSLAARGAPSTGPGLFRTADRCSRATAARAPSSFSFGGNHRSCDAIAPFSSSFGGSDGSGARSSSALFMGRRSKKKYPPRPPMVLKVPENGETPVVAMVYPERYRTLLNEKVSNMERTMRESITNATVTSGSSNQTDNISLPPTEVFESLKEGYRMRANFKMWRSGGKKKKQDPQQNEGHADDRETELQEEEEEEPVKVDYVMFERGDNRTPNRVLKYPMGSPLLQELMDPVKLALESDEELHRMINDVRFLTTLSGDALVTITYNRPIGDDWRVAAACLVQELEKTVIGKENKITLVGRSRKVKLVVHSGSEGGDGPPSPQDEATVRETLKVPMALSDQGDQDGVETTTSSCNTREFHYVQTEGAFSQPNAFVCQSMLGWAHDATTPTDSGGTNTGDGDLCELYCGNGCFTVVLASNFRRVVATELSKASVELAQHNLAANRVDNARVAKLSAEDFVLAYEGQRSFRRLEEAGIRFASSAGRGDGDAGTEHDVDPRPPPVAFDRLHTLFVDPPRAGLDATCRALAAQFRRVVYVSCNPETLARDVAELAATHDITRLAAFDQFPYTPHLEAGVVLERKQN